VTALFGGGAHNLDGAHLQTLEGHNQFVRALAVGVEGRVYSGSLDTTVRVWSGNDGALLHVLAANAAVHALAVGLDGAVHAGLANGDIKVWSGLDGKHLRTLRWPGCASITSLAVGLNGVLFAGTCSECATPDFSQELYRDNIVLFSGSDGARIGSLCSQYSERGPDLYSVRSHRSPRVNALAVGRNGKLYAALDTGGIHVFSGPGASSHLQTLRGHGFSVECLAVSPSDDTLCSGSGREAFARVW
jgi:WD40 repeat protein